MTGGVVPRPPFKLFEPFFSSCGGRFVAYRNARQRQRLEGSKLPLTQSHVKRFRLDPLLRNLPQSLRNLPVFQQQLPPSQRSKPNPTPKRMQGRQGHYAAAAAAAAMMFACSVAAAHAPQQVAASYSLGTWSTATLSVARYYLAATSLPNQGLAIFAGGRINGM